MGSGSVSIRIPQGTPETMSGHREVPIKVNAWVDEGIAPLVAALNDSDRVWTTASCEDDAAGGLTPFPAYVMFSYEGSGFESARFVAELAEALGGSVPYCLQTDWRAGNREPLLTISCPPGQVSELANAVKRAVGPAGGMARRGLRSC